MEETTALVSIEFDESDESIATAIEALPANVIAYTAGDHGRQFFELAEEISSASSPEEKRELLEVAAKATSGTRRVEIAAYLTKAAIVAKLREKFSTFDPVSGKWDSDWATQIEEFGIASRAEAYNLVRIIDSSLTISDLETDRAAYTKTAINRLLQPKHDDVREPVKEKARQRLEQGERVNIDTIDSQAAEARREMGIDVPDIIEGEIEDEEGGSDSIDLQKALEKVRAEATTLTSGEEDGEEVEEDARIDSLKGEIRDREIEIAELKKKNSELEAQLDDFEEQLNDLEDHLDGVEEENSKLKRQLGSPDAIFGFASQWLKKWQSRERHSTVAKIMYVGEGTTESFADFMAVDAEEIKALDPYPDKI
jgi:hypothetical protein